ERVPGAPDAARRGLPGMDDLQAGPARAVTEHLQPAVCVATGDWPPADDRSAERGPSVPACHLASSCIHAQNCALVCEQASTVTRLDRQQASLNTCTAAREDGRLSR